MNTISPVQCRAWTELGAHAESWKAVQLRALFADDPARGTRLVARAPGLRYDFSRQRLGAVTLRLLAKLAAERDFAQWRDALLAGKPVNDTEQRAAWASRRPPRWITMLTSARARSTSRGRRPARCSWSRAARGTSSTRPTSASLVQPRPGRPTSASAPSATASIV
ncbi:MAG TPA: hypothetical protein VHG88_12960 [Burkholderiales bacterium]|nr:hypothetical protein [Burkholderiales bacterium]